MFHKHSSSAGLGVAFWISSVLSHSTFRHCFLEEEIYYHISSFRSRKISPRATSRHPHTRNMSFCFYIRREPIFPFSRLLFLLFSSGDVEFCLRTKTVEQGKSFRSSSRLNLRKQRNLFSKQYQSNENPNDLTWNFPFPSLSPDRCWHWRELTNFSFACLKNLFRFKRFTRESWQLRLHVEKLSGLKTWSIIIIIYGCI